MLAELYRNSLYAPDPTHVVARYWVVPQILVGGSILDSEDWVHLRDVFGITGVICVESEHSDSGKGIEKLCELPTLDDGQPKPKELFVDAIVFAREVLGAGGRLYVHCQMGGSRSPAFAYAILRAVLGMSQGAARTWIAMAKPGYGEHPVHQTYLASADSAVESYHS